ncbi:MAG: helix-turn-helix transcriptional regulator [Maritimibacter sp.]|nr:helix-turn-helix transcriptional regulator [Maritimibacter sp.]
MGTPPGRDAPVREVMARLGDNWSALILKVLATGTYRHATLKRVIGALSSEGEISQRMLTLRLRTLERDGFVARTEQPTVPPRVCYDLTELGRGLVAEFDRMLGWIETHEADITDARARFRDD